MKQKPKRVLIIDAETQTITEGSVTTLADCQKIVGGLIERGFIFDNGDELYVNEEGMLGQPKNFFLINDNQIPYAGNAYVIGKVTRGGNNMDAKTKVEDLLARTHFRRLP